MHPGSLASGGFARLTCHFGNNPGLLEWVFCGARPVEGNFCYCRPRDSPLVSPVPTPSAHCRPCDLRRWRHKDTKKPVAGWIASPVCAGCFGSVSSVSAEASSPLSPLLYRCPSPAFGSSPVPYLLICLSGSGPFLIFSFPQPVPVERLLA